MPATEDTQRRLKIAVTKAVDQTNKKKPDWKVVYDTLRLAVQEGYAEVAVTQLDVATLDILEIKQILFERYGKADFEQLLRDEGWGPSPEEFRDKVGFMFEFVDGERDNESYTWVWKFGKRMFAIGGAHSSWDASEMDDLSTFYEVEQIEKTVTVYQKKK